MNRRIKKRGAEPKFDKGLASMQGKRKGDNIDYEYYEQQALGKFNDPNYFRLGHTPNYEDDLILPDEQAEHDMLKGHMEDLSYAKTQKHIFDAHPRDRVEMKKWTWWKAKIRYLPLPLCCNRLKKTRWVTEPAKEIGLGATLFLMTNKAFFWLFVLFALINIPLMGIYMGGNGLSPVIPGFIGFLGRLSLGNLGTSTHVCNKVNVGNYEKTFFLSCPYGTMKELF